MKKKLILLTIIIVASIQLLIFTVRGNDPAPVFGNLRKISVPFNRGWLIIEQGVRGWSSFFASKNHLVVENRFLVEEIGRLQTKNSLLVEQVRELTMLMEATLIEEKMPFEVIPSQIIARDPYDWLGKVVLDRGSRDGIVFDLTVVTYQGLVGRIEEVYETYSVARLLLSPELATGAIVQRTRDIGVIVGDGSGLCSLNYISRTSDIQPQDLIVTSGLGISSPRGIVIGQVLEVRSSEGSLFKEVMVEPASDFSGLEQLFIIRNPQE